MFRALSILEVFLAGVGMLAIEAMATDTAVVPLPAAHAHNDYLHPRPLIDALEQGFCSVEADVFLVAGDQLLVGHTRSELTPERTLERLYLKPLQDRVERHEGRVYPAGPIFTLLVDFKSEAATTYAALKKLLVPYQTMLCRIEEGRWIPGAVQIVISGDRPITPITESKTRVVFLDGRLPDLEQSVPVHVMPLISDRWSAYFRWRGEGPIPDSERQRLQQVVAQAHDRGQRIRFWATPDRIEVWRVLQDAGVDLINTDDLAGLATFLRSATGEAR